MRSTHTHSVLLLISMQHGVSEVNPPVLRNMLVTTGGTKAAACRAPEIALVSIHRTTLLCPIQSQREVTIIMRINWLQNVYMTDVLWME